ncbi:hypothetical protein BD410DRAFT_825774 [Rickenella mellea]|uniref:HNH nuclease domain-containing protein n=1 Tax=Rickenella mellea TaxID=50990 RepID=A0A4Y7QG40_9AGAM|nr:hypothetical protein BD410DRAFT_825774 [Rickenella mellea]
MDHQPTDSSPAFEPIDDIPLGHVRLVLERNSSFYLDIPLDVMRNLCLKPRKYLVYLGWCILGTEGKLTGRDGSELMELEGGLDDKGLYYYVTGTLEKTDLSQAIDLEVIKQSTVHSGTTDSHKTFADTLLQRDNCCVFTGLDKSLRLGMHIIPYARGSEWLRLIIANRPKYGEEVEDLVDIEDIRNGISENPNIRMAFDLRHLVILKTPNHVLTNMDVPQRAERRSAMPEDVAYPDNERYTLQWLVIPGVAELRYFADHNMDAAFKKETEEPKPSELLLHYNYGAAAVRHWGHGMGVLQERPNLPRPTGPVRTRKERSAAIRKRDRTQGEWDADDIVLFFWANTPAARERRRKEQEERTQYMEAWRQGVEPTAD